MLMGRVGNMQGRERLRRHRLRSEIGNASAHSVERFPEDLQLRGCLSGTYWTGNGCYNCVCYPYIRR